MRAGLRALLGLWRREPHLGLPALLAVLWLPALPVHLWLDRYRAVLAGAHPFINDFSFYYRAAARFAADPTALYADPEFLYPPLSVLAFLPALAVSEGAAYVGWGVLTALLALLAAGLTGGLYERTTGEALPGAVRASLAAVLLASAPVYQNLKYGQVNVAVLVAALLFLRWHARRPVAAALALGGGAWLKVYPLALAPLGAAGGRPVRFALGLGLALIALPVALLPVIPLELHRTLWLERLPQWSGLTYTAALNQSVVGVLTRAGLPADAALRPAPLPAAEAARLTGAALAVLAFGALSLAAFARRLPVEAAGVVALALLPVCSALGWEHTYALALPLLAFALLAGRRRGRGARLLTGAATLVMLTPRPPGGALAWVVAHVPRPLLDLVFARFLLVTLLLGAAVVAWAWRAGTPGAAGASADPS